MQREVQQTDPKTGGGKQERNKHKGQEMEKEIEPGTATDRGREEKER